MRHIWMIIILLVILISGCEEEATTPEKIGFAIETPTEGALNAYPIFGYLQTDGRLAPEIDGRGSELIWAYEPTRTPHTPGPPPYEITTEGGKDGFAPTVTIKALYDNWFLYLLIQWEDETESFAKNTWWFGEGDPEKYTTINVFDTTFIYYNAEDTVSTNRRIKQTVQKDWTMISSTFTGNIETVTYKTNVIIDSTKSPTKITYEDVGTTSKINSTLISGNEDGFVIMFNPSSTEFMSCSNFCHGNTMKTNTIQAVDVWHWSAHRTNFLGYSDDKFLSNDGFHGDFGDSSYVINLQDEKPKYVDILDPGMNSNFLRDSIWVTIIPFSDKLPWEGGHTVPGYILHKPTQQRGDIKAVGSYSAGKWTLEIKRLLQTSEGTDDTDIQFDPNSNAEIDFHIAVFDNAEGVDHAVSTGVHKIHFLQLENE